MDGSCSFNSHLLVLSENEGSRSKVQKVWMDCRSDHQSSRASSKISKLMHVCCQQVCNKQLKNLVRYSDDSDAAAAAAAENDNSIKMLACSNEMVQENNQKHDGDTISGRSQLQLTQNCKKHQLILES